MSNFDNAVSLMDAALFNEFASPGVYNGTSACSVVIDLDVEQFGSFDTTTPARRHEVSFLVSEISNPKRGQTIETSGKIYTLDGSITNDGRVARWHINEN
ncbi:hypothetical protein A3765_13890 [Oleiphilus sp. HI0130]|nr:hypothetical protein A3765_16210 [Oleiphilus sp. HI0130]KZZ71562.1 hypothetical protein A3765_13890 [Oleiphilus sp. HI0130]